MRPSNPLVLFTFICVQCDDTFQCNRPVAICLKCARECGIEQDHYSHGGVA
ncbi:MULTISPECIES: hypothetical protein [Mycolicibacterium]|uniref:Uncharacterized protein n=1 Tax=Mycobacterium phage Bipper TaxID=1805457 RepID=A0A142F2I7_9CAUD|nr:MULTISPECIES: hypothetical protein [Mycolicibacterium]YP_009303206.1 hypothetical protein KCH39_gp118 [Mycobacterium phage Bipper]QDF19345.1 hypothetical protein SEA_CRACKLEWINK_59 [Mycobacterium phage Cracklewink]AMQ66994.1 hypothetical protein SEA_BIPPER_59 [Mycobacterium phage Bipper]MCC9181165.1 hypothetical protein [Mycolicibacterium mageritense]UBV14866.1 hypothetical protein H8Z57_29950 [Mycolicibacterium fortuitum]